MTRANNSSFPEKLRSLRTARGLDQSDFPGISRSSIQRWEAGTQCPSRKSLLILAKTLRVEPYDLMDKTHWSASRNKSLIMAEEAAAAGNWLDALHYGGEFSRWVNHIGDLELMDLSTALMAKIVKHISPDLLFAAAINQADSTLLNYLSGVLFLGGHVWDALRINTVLLEREIPGSERSIIMIRNRAKCYTALGYLSISVTWLDRSLQYGASLGEPMTTQVLTMLSRSIAAIFAGERIEIIPNNLASYRHQNSIIWRLYWFFELHAAWFAEDWHALKRGYRRALSEFNFQWYSVPAEVVFAGIRSALAAHEGQRDAADTLQAVIADYASDNDDAYRDLIHDWLHLLLQTHHPDAPHELLAQIDQYATRQHWGWIGYWSQHADLSSLVPLVPTTRQKELVPLLLNPPSSAYDDPLLALMPAMSDG